MASLNLNGKRGNAFLDSLTLIIVLLVFSIVTIVGYNVFTPINDDIQASSDFNNLSKQNLNNLHTAYPSTFDYGFLTVLILFWITMLVASFMIDSHPIFFVVTILLLLFTLFFGAIVSNAFGEVTDDDNLNADSFPITRFIMNKLPFFILFIGFSVGIVLFGKYKGGGGGL